VSHGATDADCFPEPEVVDPRRPVDSYLQFGAGPNAFLGGEIGKAALTEMFRAVWRVAGVKRAVGPQGELKKVADGGRVQYMREDWGTLTPFPVTMKVRWD